MLYEELGYDYDYDIYKVALMVWNPSTLAWERMKQPTLELTGDLTVTLGDVERALTNQYFKRRKRYLYASGRIKYICKNTDIDANETDTDWLIWKYQDESSPGEEGPRTGAVNNEAAINALSWNT